MKRTAFYYWIVADERTGKRRRTGWLMSDQTAADYPGAVRIEPAAEYRDLPETLAELARAAHTTPGGPPRSL